MIPLQTITGRIKTLITSLTKKNFNKSLIEVNLLLKISTMYSEEHIKNSNNFIQNMNMNSNETNNSIISNRSPIISALLDELDFRDLRNIGGKDEQKVK
jgi:hypothetical protein